MDDSSDDGAAILAHATPRRHSWASVHTPIDWSSAGSLRAELARVDARRATLLSALATLENVDDEAVIRNSSSDEESCCDLTQATTGPSDDDGERTPPPPPVEEASSDEDLVDLTQSRVRARDAPTPARDGASSDDEAPSNEADARVAIARLIKASPELYEPILLRTKVDANEIARLCGADAKTVKAYLDDEGVPNVRKRAVQKRTRVRSPQVGGGA